VQTKRAKEREKMTAKMRRSTLFRYRIVITVPPWSVIVMASAIGFGLLTKPILATNIVSFVLVVASFICVWMSRRIVRGLRHDVHEALNNINNDDSGLILKTDEYDPEDEPKTFRLKKVNDQRSARVSE
jgi:hypothetical protein